MKLINSSVEYIPQTGYTLQDIYKQIERAGRTCYKSEDRITESSAESFVEMLNNNKHRAMFEHGVCYLSFTIENCNNIKIDEARERYETNPYSKVVIGGAGIYITTNFRVIVENIWFDDLKYLTEPTLHEKCYCAKFICSRAIANEIVRHRMSFAQESTRYCNYSKNKFKSELTFIIPNFLNLESGKYDSVHEDYESGGMTYNVNGITKYTDKVKEKCFINICQYTSRAYLQLIVMCNELAQNARDVLPLCLKTELVVTGFESSWKNFFELRCDKAAHPDIQILANRLKQRLIDEGANV